MKKYFKHFTFALTALTWGSFCHGQQLAWQQTSKWTIYNVRGVKFYKVSVDSLDKYGSIPINDDSVKAFLSHATVLPPDKVPLWMGAYVTSCLFANKKIKIDISTYGGFLFDEGDKKYYQIPQSLQRDWLNYLAGCSGAASAK